MATRDFQKIPGASKPGQATDLGKRNQDIDKYLSISWLLLPISSCSGVDAPGIFSNFLFAIIYYFHF